MANYAYMNPGKQHLGYRFDSPPSFQRGYDEFNQPLRSVMWKTAVVLNRRAYIGNVKVTDIDGDSVTYPDAIFKSDPNRFDLFSLLHVTSLSIHTLLLLTLLACL